MQALFIGLLILLCLLLVAAFLPPVWFWLRNRRARRRGEGESYAEVVREESAVRHPTTPDFSEFPCGRGEPHEKAAWPKTLTVLGKSVGIESATICPSCAEAFFNKYAATCASCGGPILPGMPVGQAWIGAPQPFTHLNFECTASGGLYCGVWGQGRLITLHEMEPETYAPGTANVMAHVISTGEAHVTRIK